MTTDKVPVLVEDVQPTSCRCDNIVDNNDQKQQQQLLQKQQQHICTDAVNVHEILTNQGEAWIIDSSINESTLQFVDEIRLALKLDSKRPTVDRRFFIDKNNCSNNNGAFSICKLLQTTIEQTLDKQCYVFQYLRFLEYTKSETQKLDPHTDGCKRCDITGYQSTHTLLLYLTTCDDNGGGETLLLKQVNPNYTTSREDNKNDNNVINAVKPIRGRILLFPHKTPHSGEPLLNNHKTSQSTKLIPKICLRAEVCLF